jgi:protein involved in polysaccharide export with SLBB domain
MRNVLVISSSGVQRRYDLYRAIREGDFTQNPYVRPGDRVVVSRASRTVVLEGGVRRPGLYQLLDGEQLGELIERYGQGVSTVGNPNRIELVRYAGADRINGKKLFVGIQDMKSGFVVEDYDVVRVTLVTDLLPVMYIEGALGLTPDADLNASTSEKVRFNPGENYASLVRARQAWFTSVSDTAHAYVKRGDLVIPMNINPMLYDASYQSEYFVEPFDVLVIPFRQYFVTVAGAVANPGRYPYIPDRDYDYYIGAAGGFNAGQNSGKSVRVFDVLGKQHSSSDPITPETTIEARSNSPLFYFNQVAPVLTTLLTIASTTFTAILTGRSLGWW